MGGAPWKSSDDRPGYMGRRDSTADSTMVPSYTPSTPQPADPLRSLRGAAFDTAFAHAMVDAHNQAISLLELAQGQAQHEELRSLIASTLPALREHLQIAQSLAGGTRS
jgi:putative membrane protein